MEKEWPNDLMEVRSLVTEWENVCCLIDLMSFASVAMNLHDTQCL
jgi:hypothetical protein